MTRKKRRSPRGVTMTAAPSAPPEHLCLMVDSIGNVGITEHGDQFGMELTFTTGERAVVMFPQAHFQSLMAALMAAGAAAYSAQIARLGSEDNVLIAGGPRPFAPTAFELGRGKGLDGRDMLLIRLKKDRLPVVDFTLPFSDAERLTREIVQELERGSSQPKAVH